MATKSTRRNTGWLGILFVVLLFLSAGMVTLPSSAQTPSAIAGFYAANRVIILIAQVVGLFAVPVFMAFAVGFDESVTSSRASRGIGFIGWAGILVAAVSLVTAVPVIWLAFTTAGLPLMVRMTDLSDAVLFLAVGAFALTTAVRGQQAPVWLRSLAALTALAALARSATGFLGVTSFLDVAAPLAFLALVLAASIYLLLVARAAA